MYVFLYPKIHFNYFFLDQHSEELLWETNPFYQLKQEKNKQSYSNVFFFSESYPPADGLCKILAGKKS